MKNLTNYIKEYVNEGLKITADTEIDDLYDTPGIYCYFKNGYMSDDEGYIKDHKDDAIGVAVIAEVEGKLHRLIVSKAPHKRIRFRYYFDMSGTGVTIADNANDAKKDFEGKKNTQAILSKFDNIKDILDEGSYIPAVGELGLIYKNRKEINDVMDVIGGESIKSAYYWSSTFCNNSSQDIFVVLIDNNITGVAIAKRNHENYVITVSSL